MGRVRGASSLVTKVGMVVAVNEEVVASAASASSPSSSSQHAKVDLKPLIVSVIPIYSLSDIINLFRFLFFI